jgi:hypothetical protein
MQERYSALGEYVWRDSPLHCIIGLAYVERLGVEKGSQ